MGFVWVNSTGGGIHSAPIMPDWLLIVVLVISLLVVLAAAWGILKAIEAFFDWLTDLIAQKVVKKMRELEEADA